MSTLNGSVTFTASDPNGAREYQFWVEEPSGQWVDAQNYSTSSTFTLSTPSAGDYLVAVEVLDGRQVAAGDWTMAETTSAAAVFVNANVTVTSSVARTAPAGTPITFTADAVGIDDPLYHVWVEMPSGRWIQSGPYQKGNTWTCAAPSGGGYRYVAYAKRAGG